MIRKTYEYYTNWNCRRAVFQWASRGYRQPYAMTNGVTFSGSI